MRDGAGDEVGEVGGQPHRAPWATGASAELIPGRCRPPIFVGKAEWHDSYFRTLPWDYQSASFSGLESPIACHLPGRGTAREDTVPLCPAFLQSTRCCVSLHPLFLSVPSFIHLQPFLPTPSVYQGPTPLGLPLLLPNRNPLLDTAAHSLRPTPGHLLQEFPPPLTFSPWHQFFLLYRL